MMATNNFAIGLRAAALVMGATGICLLIQNVIVRIAVSIWGTPTEGTVFYDIFPLLDDAPWRIAILFACVILVGRKADWLWPKTLNWRFLLLATLAGLVFSAAINSATHTFLFDLFNIGAAVETAPKIMPTILQILVYGFIGIVLAPLSEEMANRGLLFSEAKSLPRIQLFIWSILVFALMHILAGGTAKVLAVMPMAVLFVVVRQLTGHWIYSAAAHTAVNLVASIVFSY